MVLITPLGDEAVLTTEQILDTIDQHADTTALILLPGIQFYTGQHLDIETITRHAHSKGILIGWDCAHAAGNIVLRLHDWDVDFAVWCTYKYLNSGPGAIGAIFVHERHGRVDMKTETKTRYRTRLTGWWGADKKTRFEMENSKQNYLGISPTLRNICRRICTNSRRCWLSSLESERSRSDRRDGVARSLPHDIHAAPPRQIRQDDGVLGESPPAEPAGHQETIYHINAGRP